MVFQQPNFTPPSQEYLRSFRILSRKTSPARNSAGQTANRPRRRPDSARIFEAWRALPDFIRAGFRPGHRRGFAFQVGLRSLPAGRPPLAAPPQISTLNDCKMAANVGESTAGGSSSDAAGGSFECNICFELPQEPIVTLCGHLFCWPCLYRWLHMHAHTSECPVCKAIVEEDKLVPLYGRGKGVDPRSRNMPGADIPNRPAGQRPATAQQADPNNFANAHANPWFMGMGGMGAGVPLANARWGNYAFSAAFGGLFPMLSFQMHGFPDPTAYAQPAGFHYGFGHGHGFHGGHMGHAHGVPRQGPLGQQHQADVYLKALLIMIGVLVIASLLAF